MRTNSNQVLMRHRGVRPAWFLLVGVLAILACPLCVRAALESGTFQTTPGALVTESGDRVPEGQRMVRFSATVTFELNSIAPSLWAEIPNAVIEGGDPFALRVRSEFGERRSDGTLFFRGDYLLDQFPTGSGYGFEWTFSEAADGRIAWDGTAAWLGGHLWQVTISDLPLEPVAVPEPSVTSLVVLGFLTLGATGVKLGRGNGHV